MPPLSAVDLVALAATLLSAAALYGGARHCLWTSWSRLRGIGTWIGLVLAVAALALWIARLGVGAGLCVMLALWMAALMALPALAAATTGAGNGAPH